MTPEGAIKLEIQQALTQLGYRWYRIQCGRWRVRGGWMHGAKEGTADLLVSVLLRGVARAFLFVETKQLTGTLREAQERFRDGLGSGEYYLEARSLDDVLGWIKQNGATR